MEGYDDDDDDYDDTETMMIQVEQIVALKNE